jgi:hypothetical protein
MNIFIYIHIHIDKYIYVYIYIYIYIYLYTYILKVLCRQPEAGGGYKLIDTILTTEEKILDGILFKIFQSENIIKLGMGPTNDLKR